MALEDSGWAKVQAGLAPSSEDYTFSTTMLYAIDSVSDKCMKLDGDDREYEITEITSGGEKLHVNLNSYVVYQALQVWKDNAQNGFDTVLHVGEDGVPKCGILGPKDEKEEEA